MELDILGVMLDILVKQKYDDIFNNNRSCGYCDLFCGALRMYSSRS
jgi:hypothetical protein